MTKYFIGIFYFLIVLFFGCSNQGLNNNETVLARVYDLYLYDSDIEGIVPPNSSANDSLVIVKNFINNWIRQQLLIKQAETNLIGEEKDFKEQLETYRNSLIIFKYESLLIKQNLDTIVSNEEIENYYSKNKENFQLKSNIVKVNYVKLDKNNLYNKNIKELIKIRDTSQILLDSLRYYCEIYAKDFIIASDQWIYFDDLLNLVPLDTYNQEAYLNEHTFVDFVDNQDQYYINFLDFSIKDEYSPLDFEKENIKKLILNKRKSELIKKMRDDIFFNALNNNDIEIF